MRGESSCQAETARDPKEKAPVPAEVWDLAAPEKEKVAVKEAVGAKAEVVASRNAKAEPRGKGKPPHRVNRCL